MKVIIAASQTGGHINPGIAIANKIKQENPDAVIKFIGTKRGLENDLVPRAGYELRTIEAYGIVRKISIDNIKKMIKTLKVGYRVKSVRGTQFRQWAKKILKEEKPDIVIGTGGFICGPVLLSASKQKIPTMLHESNAFPGVTVKLLAKKVDTILIGFEDAREKIHDAKNIVLTGTPTKFKEVEYNENEKDEFLKENKLNKNQTLILVFGGSQGARPINNALEEIIEKKLNTNYQILWSVGKSQYDIIKENLAKKDIDIEKIENVKVVPYIYDMQKAMSVADLIVCRSGAMTITEVSISGRPAIFVPLSFAAENHQEYNAKVLVKENAAKIIHDNEINGEALNNLINETIKDKEKLKEMGNNARKIVMKDVENKIYNEVKRLVNKG